MHILLRLLLLPFSLWCSHNPELCGRQAQSSAAGTPKAA